MATKKTPRDVLGLTRRQSRVLVSAHKSDFHLPMPRRTVPYGVYRSLIQRGLIRGGQVRAATAYFLTPEGQALARLLVAKAERERVAQREDD